MQAITSETDDMDKTCLEVSRDGKTASSARGMRHVITVAIVAERAKIVGVAREREGPTRLTEPTRVSSESKCRTVTSS